MDKSFTEEIKATDAYLYEVLREAVSLMVKDKVINIDTYNLYMMLSSHIVDIRNYASNGKTLVVGSIVVQ